MKPVTYLARKMILRVKWDSSTTIESCMYTF